MSCADTASLLILNDDIFENVLAFMFVGDVLRLEQCCRRLRSAGSKC